MNKAQDQNNNLNTPKGMRIMLSKNSQVRMPRMRTVTEAISEIKQIDPHTAMTKYHIRRLCLDGVLPAVKAGKKLLINLDTLIEYMADPTAEKFQPSTATTVNGIRRIG